MIAKNNNQEQTPSTTTHLPHNLIPIHETSLTKTVLQLDLQIQTTQKHYHTVKKPIKYFSKAKRSCVQVKNNSVNVMEVGGVLKEKVVPPNANQILQCAEKSPLLYNSNARLKNVFEAYKDTLQEKYRKRMRAMEKSALKISVNNPNNPHHLSQPPSCQQTTTQKQLLIKPRLSSNKRIDASIMIPTQPAPTHHATNRESLIKSIIRPTRQSCSSRTFQPSIINDDTNSHNFIKSGPKRSQVLLTIPNQHYDNHHHNKQQQANLYQVKRKCYTQQRQDCSMDGVVDAEGMNKTKNVSFRIPPNNSKEKRKSVKCFIERIGGLTYNLPGVEVGESRVKGGNGGENENTQTISYLVKSLRKPSLSQNSKPMNKHTQFNGMPMIDEHMTQQKAHCKNPRDRRLHTLEPYHQQRSIYTQCQLLNDHINTQEYICLLDPSKRPDLNTSNNNKRLKYQLRHQKEMKKKKPTKFNYNSLLGRIEGWDIEEGEGEGVMEGVGW